MIETMLFRKPVVGDGSIVAGAFTPKAASSVGHGGHAIALIDNKIYVYGGSNAVLNTVMEVYDIATDKWTVVAPVGSPPAGRHNAAFCVLNNKLYLFSGCAAVGWTGWTAEAWCYDFTTKVWTRIANCPVTQGLMTAVAIKGKIYLYGGFQGGGGLTTLLEYDPVNNSYRSIAHTKGGRYGHRCLAINDKMYIIAGHDSTGPVLSTLCYDPSDNTWETLPNIPTGTRHPYAGHIGDFIYVYGGYTGSAASVKLWKYNLVTKVWTALPDGTLTTYLGCAVTTPDGVWAHGGGTDTAVFNTLTKIS